MDRERLAYSDSDDWIWARAQHSDVEEMLALTDDQFSQEISGILTPNPTRLTYHLHKAILTQTYQPGQECITVARHKSSNMLLAWSWCERGKYTPYADEEMAVAEIAHLDLDLSKRIRLRLTGQMLDLWITWASMNQIPVLCSTSIRDQQTGFMRLHDLYGFQRRGSFAYRRIL